jgi:small subunit ribosomal protein S18
MSDPIEPQIEPMGEEQEEAEEVKVPQPITPAASAPAVSSLFEEDDDYDSDEDEDEEEDEEEGDDDNIVEGPAEYVQREKSGRGRRIGSEVRPDDVDYKNIPLLSRFLDRRGRILSRRKTRVSAKVQRRIVQAIKRARHLALLPYTADQTRIVRSKRR